MDEITVRVETEIFPTETEEKVRTAVKNLFGNMVMQVKPYHRGSSLTATANGQEALVKFRNALRNDRIRDAARKVLFNNTRNETISFCLNKQVAFAGHISFSEQVSESPLGPLKIVFKSKNPRQLVEWLAPRTI